MTQGGDDMDTTTTATTKTGPGRSTALRSRRRAYDLILASHYHYGRFGISPDCQTLWTTQDHCV